MKDMERAQQIVVTAFNEGRDLGLLDLMNAIALTREDCAKACDSLAAQYALIDEGLDAETAEQCAAALRERGK